MATARSISNDGAYTYHTADDRDKAEPLGEGDRVLVDKGANHGGEHRLGGLDDLGERHGAGAEGEHGAGMGAGGAETDRKELKRVLLGDLRGVAGIRGGPEEECVDDA